MKNLIFLLFIACAVSFFSCARNVVKNATKTEINETEKEKIQAHTETNTESVTETTRETGDSLNTSLHFDEENASDSVESSGLFIKGTLVKTNTGYKVKLKAVAKPVKITDKTTTKIQENKTVLTDKKKEQTTSTIKKEKEVKPSLEGILQYSLIIGFLLFLLWFIIRLAKRGLIGK